MANLYFQRPISGVGFYHRDDFTGSVVISTGVGEVTVSFDDLKAFVASYVRQKRHQAIDAMDDEDLLRAWAIR
jgi:hypothetical protein